MQEERKLPEGWRWIRLGELCELKNGSAFKESDWSQQGLPIIRIQNLNDPRKPFNHWNGSIHGKVEVNSGDVLLAWSGTPGTSFGAHLWTRGRGVLNQHIFRVDSDSTQVIGEWLVGAINQQLDRMIAQSQGAVGLRHVTKGELQALTVAIPTLAEQQAIITRLRTISCEVEKANLAAQAQLTAVQSLSRRYWNELFLSVFKKNCPSRKLENVAQLLTSKSISSSGDVQVSAITTACLTEFGFNSAGIKSALMTRRDANQCSVSVGEILVARSNTPELVGRVAQYVGTPENIVASDLTIRILASQEIRSAYLCGYLSYLYLSGYWLQNAAGASGTMKKITRAQLSNLEVPVPTLDEQDELIERAKRISDLWSKATEAARAQALLAKALCKSIVNQSFRGEL